MNEADFWNLINRALRKWETAERRATSAENLSEIKMTSYRMIESAVAKFSPETNRVARPSELCERS